MDIVRVERVDFQIAPGVFIEFYRFPDGEKRIGKTSAAIVCGHKKNYLSRLQDATPNQWKALQGRGFDGYSRTGMVERGSVGGRGAAKTDTLSLDDFKAFIRFSAFDMGKKPALALADALIGVALETVARKAFGEDELTLEDVRNYICKQYAKTVQWLEEDREDFRQIDEHLLFLEVN